MLRALPISDSPMAELKWLAGRLFEKLRKIHLTNKRRNWFDEMWPALKSHHDSLTPGGLQPRQIHFGRDLLGSRPFLVR